MSLEVEKPSEQRERTDESLRLERERVDGAFSSSHERDEQAADRIVQLARESSDAVLKAARERVDRKVTEARAAAQVAAGETLAEERLLEDQLLLRAREDADVVLNLAREKADQLVEKASAQAVVPSTITVEARLAEDVVRRSERALTDERIQRVRDESLRALSKLLPLEREATDRYLLTERARSDAALSSRDDFLAMVSHDLRSLLGGIVMCADLLAYRATKDAAGREVVVDAGHIQHYAARMNRLIGDLVDVVSIDAGKFSLRSERGDVNPLVAEACESFALSATHNGVTLRVQPSEQARFASFDRERLLQVFANLIANALKFTPRGGRVTLAVECCDDELCFSVRDTGTGIPRPMLDSIFERFWQAGENDSRGLGLGLYISKCIVEAHGGRIWAQSESGHGSVVWFTLPALDAQESATPTVVAKA
jgi:signal transduction histidine kinase